MTPIRTLCLLAVAAGSLLSGCGVLPQLGSPEERPLREALQEYTSAKTESQRKGDPAAQEKLEQARKTYEETALTAALARRDQGDLFQARQLLDTALEQMPGNQTLLDARQAIETRRTALLRINDCRLGAARADYLMDKAELLQQRGPLDMKDYLQDWQIRRERQELDQLATQLRDCAIQALADRQLALAEDTIAAARRVRGEEFVAAELQQLAQIKNPRPAASSAEAKKPAPKRPAELTPQQKIRQARVALQSAMTRGDLRQAKAQLAELRRLEGETPQLVELDNSVSEAIAAYIADAHEQANALYRDRQIVQARDLWQKILELAPDDTQARANLERAERVLKKLEELQGLSPETPTTTPAPSPAVP